MRRAAIELRKRFRPAMTGAELARELGVTRQAVGNWLAGTHLPSPDLMARIEDLTGIPMRAWTEDVESEDCEGLTGTEHA